MTNSNLAKTLADLAVMDKLPPGAYVDLPDGRAAWHVHSVQILPDGFRVNNKAAPIFSGHEAVKHYFDVRNFAGVIREILTHQILVLANGEETGVRHFNKAQKQAAILRQKLEWAYLGIRQQDETGLELWMLGLEAYVLVVEDGQRLDDVLRLSNKKLAGYALKRGRELIAEESEVAYFYEKR